VRTGHRAEAGTGSKRLTEAPYQQQRAPPGRPPCAHTSDRGCCNVVITAPPVACPRASLPVGGSLAKWPDGPVLPWSHAPPLAMPGTCREGVTLPGSGQGRTVGSQRARQAVTTPRRPAGRCCARMVLERYRGATAPSVSPVSGRDGRGRRPGSNAALQRRPPVWLWRRTSGCGWARESRPEARRHGGTETRGRHGTQGRGGTAMNAIGPSPTRPRSPPMSRDHQPW